MSLQVLTRLGFWQERCQSSYFLLKSFDLFLQATHLEFPAHDDIVEVLEFRIPFLQRFLGRFQLRYKAVKSFRGGEGCLSFHA